MIASNAGRMPSKWDKDTKHAARWGAYSWQTRPWRRRELEQRPRSRTVKGER